MRVFGARLHAAHLRVAAKGNRRDAELRAAPGEANVRTRQAQHELGHTHAESARREEVAAFVNEDEHRKHYDDVENHQDDVHLWPLVRDASRRGADELAASTLRIDPESAPIPPLDGITPLVPRPKRLAHPTTFSVFTISACDYAKSRRVRAMRCHAVAKRTEERQARWRDGTVARWHGGTMARWHDGTMARWADSKAALRPCPFSRKNGRDLRL